MFQHVADLPIDELVHDRLAQQIVAQIGVMSANMLHGVTHQPMAIPLGPAR